MVGTEAAGERLGELGDLGAHPPFGQIGQLGRVTFSADQRCQHRPPRYAGDVARHRGQLDAGILEELFETLDLPGPVARDRGACAGQVS